MQKHVLYNTINKEIVSTKKLHIFTVILNIFKILFLTNR